MCQIVKSSADRQFRRNCQIAVGLSLILYITSLQASLRMHDGPARLVLSGLSGAAIFAEFISVGLLVARLRDEFQRTLLLRSFVWATVITMAIAFVWGAVEENAHGLVPHMSVIWIPLILVCITAAAKVLIFRQYRPGNE